MCGAWSEAEHFKWQLLGLTFKPSTVYAWSCHDNCSVHRDTMKLVFSRTFLPLTEAFLWTNKKMRVDREGGEELLNGTRQQSAIAIAVGPHPLTANQSSTWWYTAAKYCGEIPTLNRTRIIGMQLLKWHFVSFRLRFWGTSVANLTLKGIYNLSSNYLILRVGGCPTKRRTLHMLSAQSNSPHSTFKNASFCFFFVYFRSFTRLHSSALFPLFVFLKCRGTFLKPCIATFSRGSDTVRENVSKNITWE